LVKYDADEVEVRIGTSAANVGSAPALTNLQSIEYDPGQTFDQPPAGIGSRLSEVHEKIIKPKGSLKRWHDEVAVVCGGTGTLEKNVGAFTTAALTPLYIEIKNKTTSKKVTLAKCMGPYSKTLDSPEGYLEETWDFFFESLSESES